LIALYRVSILLKIKKNKHLITRKIHCLSGFIISIFIALHLFNHTISIVGVEQHIAFMNKMRYYYRNTVTESFLLLAFFLQIFTGLQLFFKQRKLVRTKFEKLHLWTGLYLVFFLIFHIGAVMLGRYVFNLDTNFYFGVAGMNIFPLSLFFIPYYGLAIFSFFFHLASAQYKNSKSLTARLSSKKKAIIIITIGILLAFIILFGATNGFRGFEIPKEYNVLEIEK